jgi:hypothetical protein
VGFVEGETGYCSETYVMCGVDGTGEVSIDDEDDIDIKEEISIKVEDDIDVKDEFSIKDEDAIDIKKEVSIKDEDPLDIKDEMLQTLSIPAIKTEHEVRYCVCVVTAVAFRPFITNHPKGNCSITLSNCILLCVILWAPYSFVLYCGRHIALCYIVGSI